MDTNILTNKVFSIIIALVVTCLVLVPLCNIDGGGGGNGPMYHNIGTHMREVDLTQPAVYEWDMSDTYDEHTLLVMWYLDQDDWDFDSPATGYKWEPSVDPSNPIMYVSAFGGTDNDAHLKVTIDGEGEFIVEEGDGYHESYNIDGAKLWIYDKNGPLYGTLLDCWEDSTPINDIRIPATTQHDLYVYINKENASGSVGYDSYRHILNGQATTDYESTWDSNDIIVESPVVSINESGNIEITGEINLNVRGYTVILSPEIVSAFGFIPEYVPLLDESDTPAESEPSSDSPSTITTLVRLVPIFVILGLISAIAIPLFGKNRGQIE